MSTFLFDIGGTKTRCAYSTAEGISDPVVFQTEDAFDAAMATFREVFLKHFSAQTFTKAVGCIAGRVNDEGEVFGARNLAAWSFKDLDDALIDFLHAPVHLENDGALVGLGEAVYGAGKGIARVAYVTVSTGVGGALIVHEAIDHEASALEVGRIVVDGGDLESLVSGTAVEKKFNVHPKDLDDMSIRTDLARVFAEGLVELDRVWDPEVIVCGGSMIVGENPIPLEVVSETLRARGSETPVKKALLKDVGGLWGGKVLSERL